MSYAYATRRLIADVVRDAAHPLTGSLKEFDPLLDVIGDARLVLLGEASHGTHEFYRERAQITKRLVTEKGFQAVAVEADWPDAYRVNSYVRGEPGDAEAIDALASFKRFPAWMWRNADVLDFIGWLREHNDQIDQPGRRVGFYGLDLYSLHASMEAVLNYLDKVDPDGAARARERYACFEQFGPDPQTYGHEAGLGLSESCEQEVIHQLLELQSYAAEYARRNGFRATDDFFYAEQNARLVKNAERYYREMFRGRVSSWNLRDHHMTETLVALMSHLQAQGRPAKIVVWAHNSHLGDARATDMARAGEMNVGQLVREHYGKNAVLVGFSTSNGTVTAASNWGGPAERKIVRPALGDSFEGLFHETDLPRFLLTFRGGGRAASVLDKPMLERAIGVIYRPETERMSHYFHARITDQFDAVLHFDHTRAVEPLERTAEWEEGELPETYPTGM
jgi:erythromycin esterase-like protein